MQRLIIYSSQVINSTKTGTGKEADIATSQCISAM